jgi:two-component system nitrate/nitrite response regulator NarL
VLRGSIEVLVAEDHPVYREGLAAAIRRHPRLELIVACASGREALDQILERHPHVAVIDVRLPDLDGMSLLETAKQQRLPTRVIFLSAVSESEFVYTAINAGVDGYISKEADRSAICAAIVDVANGRTVFSPELASGIAEQIRERHAAERSPLTSREQQILELLAEGCSARAIGARLFLSPATVKTHLRRIYDKLDVSHGTAAVAEGMRRGLVR